MTRTRAWVVGLGCWALAGCGGVTLKGDAGPEGGSGDAAAESPAMEDGADAPAAETKPDVSTAADAKDALVVKDALDAKDAADAREAGPTDAPVCPTESDNGAPTPSTACTVVPASGATCSTGATCPVGAMFQLSCPGGGYGPWIVPSNGGGTVMFVTNTGSFVTRLFTMGPGAVARAEDVPGLTSAANALAADADGNPTILAGEMPGIWRVRKTAQGWRRELAVEVDGADKALVFDARVRPTKVFTTYEKLADEQTPRLAVRDASCWRSSILPGTRTTFASMDVDTNDQAWVSWYGYADASKPAVDLAGPDGLHRVWTAPVAGGLRLVDRPRVLAGGLTGTDARPALAIQQGDGVRVLAPVAGGTGWSERLLAGSAMASQMGNCPVATGFGGCGGLTACTTTSKGALYGFGIARTASGRVYVAWLAGEGESTYSLMQTQTGGVAPVCPFAPGLPAAAVAIPTGDGGVSGVPMVAPQCFCTRTLMSSRGTVSVVVTRVDGATPVEALRVQIDAGAEPHAEGLAIAARGDTLLVVASNATFNTALRYLEIDTTKLP